MYTIYFVLFIFVYTAFNCVQSRQTVV